MPNKNKVFYSDPRKDQLVGRHTFNLLTTLKRLGLEFKVPIREILQPATLDGTMLDRFYKAFVRTDDK